MDLILPRRAFLKGLVASLIAAPAIIRLAPLMPIKPPPIVLAHGSVMVPEIWALADLTPEELAAHALPKEAYDALANEIKLAFVAIGDLDRIAAEAAFDRNWS